MFYLIIIILLVVVFAVAQISSFKRNLTVKNHNVDNAMAQIGVQIALQWDILDLLQQQLLTEAGKAVTLFDYESRKQIKGATKPTEIVEQCKCIADGFQMFEYIQNSTPQIQTDAVCCEAVQAFKSYSQMLDTSRKIYNNAAQKANQTLTNAGARLVAKLLGFTYREFLEELPHIL